MPPENYWVAVATIMPVLALAVVVEMRTSSALWDADPAFIRGIRSVSVFLVLASLTLGEGLSLSALQTGKAEGSWVTLADVSVAAAMSLLAINPALSMLVRSNADTIGRLFGIAAFHRWRSRRLRRHWQKSRSIALGATESIRRGWDETLETVLQSRAEVEARVATGELPWSRARIGLAGLEAIEQRIRELIHENDDFESKGLQTMESLEADLAAYRESIRVREKLRRELATQLLREP